MVGDKRGDGTCEGLGNDDGEGSKIGGHRADF